MQRIELRPLNVDVPVKQSAANGAAEALTAANTALSNANTAISDANAAISQAEADIIASTVEISMTGTGEAQAVSLSEARGRCVR